MLRLKPLRPFIGPARTSLRQQYFSEPSRSHPPPREAESTVRSGDFWSALRSNRPRAMPLDFGNPPRNNERGPLVKRGRPWSIPSQQMRKPRGSGWPLRQPPEPWCSRLPQQTTTPRRPTTCHAWLPPSTGWLVQQWGRSKPLARATWFTSLQPSHPQGVVSSPVLSPNYYHQVLRANQTRAMAR
jgi:hypothetical protein